MFAAAATAAIAIGLWGIALLTLVLLHLGTMQFLPKDFRAKVRQHWRVCGMQSTRQMERQAPVACPGFKYLNRLVRIAARHIVTLQTWVEV
jgi:hypothetical protein